MFVCRNSKFVYRVYRKCFTTYWVSHRDSNNQNQSTYFLVHILSKYLDYESNCEQPLQVLSRRFFFRSPRSNPLFDLILIVISLRSTLWTAEPKKPYLKRKQLDEVYQQKNWFPWRWMLCRGTFMTNTVCVWHPVPSTSHLNRKFIVCLKSWVHEKRLS